MSLSTGVMAPHCPQVWVLVCLGLWSSLCHTLHMYRNVAKHSVFNVFHVSIVVILLAHMMMWLICCTIQRWPVTRASSALHPPTGCRCLKWRGCDITALETQWPLCALTASQMPAAYPGGCQAMGRPMWEIMLPGSSVSPYDRSDILSLCLFVDHGLVTLGGCVIHI